MTLTTGHWSAETVEWLNRASRYGEAEELAVVALAEAGSPEVEAEIRPPASGRTPSTATPAAGGGEPPRAAVGRHQRGHPGTAPGVAGLQPGVAGQKRAMAHGSRRGCRGCGSHR